MNLKDSDSRKKLEVLVTSKKFDEIGLEGGITTLERRDYDSDAKDLYSCEKYALGTNRLPWSATHDWNNPPEGYAEISEPQCDDLVIYFSEGLPNHIGRYISDNNVRSKWGGGYIFQHQLEEVPSFYGNEVKFFRESE